MAITLFSNNPSTTVTSGGTTNTDTSWTVASSAAFPAASNSAVPATLFHVADPAAPSELIAVTNVSGTTWTVTRGAEGTTACVHAAGFTVYQVVSAGDLTAMKQATGALTAPVTYSNSITEFLIASYEPVAGEIAAGTTFEMVATGSILIASVAPTLTWNLRWGWVSSVTPGTSILSLVTGTNCSALTTNAMTATGRSFDLNATVTFISTTSAIANINFWFNTNATTGIGTGVRSNATAVTGLTAPPAGGPLALTALWGGTAASASNSLVAPGPLIYRAG